MNYSQTPIVEVHASDCDRCRGAVQFGNPSNGGRFGLGSHDGTYYSSLFLCLAHIRELETFVTKS